MGSFGHTVRAALIGEGDRADVREKALAAEAATSANNLFVGSLTVCENQLERCHSVGPSPLMVRRRPGEIYESRTKAANPLTRPRRLQPRGKPRLRNGMRPPGAKPKAHARLALAAWASQNRPPEIFRGASLKLLGLAAPPPAAAQHGEHD